VIVCICNGLSDRDVKEICNNCQTKRHFTECMKVKMAERSCLTCYAKLIESFEKEKGEQD